MAVSMATLGGKQKQQTIKKQKILNTRLSLYQLATNHYQNKYK